MLVIGDFVVGHYSAAEIARRRKLGALLRSMQGTIEKVDGWNRDPQTPRIFATTTEFRGSEAEVAETRNSMVLKLQPDGRERSRERPHDC